MTQAKPIRVVDHAALRSNQAFIIGFSLLAFVSNSALIAGLVAASMLAGTVLRTQAFRWAYTGLLLRLRLVRPDPIPDHAEPHRFAQGLGGLFLAVGVLALLAKLPLVGWALVWLVIFLAGVNLFLGFCVGCFVYYWLARWQLPGFSHSPPGDTFPGLRPPRA
jgi:hypothetical protein